MKVSGPKSGSVSKSGGAKGSARSSGASKSRQDQVEAAGPTLSGLGADAVEVSDSVQTIEIIKGLVDATPDIRTGEVERIAKKLRDGTYKIDYEKVAEAFIREVIKNEIAKKPRTK